MVEEAAHELGGVERHVLVDVAGVEAAARRGRPT